MPPLSFGTVILLSGCLVCFRSAAQQKDSFPLRSDPSLQMDMSPYDRDPLPAADPTPEIQSVASSKKHHMYLMVTPGTGVGKLFSGNNYGILNVSFPYSVNGGPDILFRSADINPYAKPKIFVFPIGLEGGDQHQFMTLDIAFSIVGSFTGGYEFAVGYGRNFFLRGFKHSGSVEEKNFVLKPSISLCYIRDAGHNGEARLGSIDNNGNTIQALGYTAAPTYDLTTTDTDPDGSATSTTSTYNANTLDISYVEREFSVMPKLSIANNPYKKGLHWELTVGYNIPLYEKGGISLIQNLKSSNSNPLSGLMGLDHPSLTTTFDGRPIVSTPFHFSGFFLGLSFYFRTWKAGTS